jgi:glycerophosphoryl diester phosphodiesterase
MRCQAQQDGVLFLMHDATLERTTNGHGIGGASMGEIAQLDAGSWHSRAYAGEALPTLEALARWCLANHLHLNVEIKPTRARSWKPAAPAAS